jgi:hypothetical protein
MTESDEREAKAANDKTADDPAGEDDTTPGPLQELRKRPRYRVAGFAGGSLVGLVAASIHWLGLIVGGVLVGLFATHTKRAPVFGLGFGVLVLLVWLGLLGLSGTAGKALSMGQFSFLPVAIGIGLPVVGSLFRGVVR